jgi:glutaredoxin 3
VTDSDRLSREKTENRESKISFFRLTNPKLRRSSAVTEYVSKTITNSPPGDTQSNAEAGASVAVYTMNYCPYCERAKQLLTQRGVGYREIRVAEEDDAAWDALEKRSGMKTMPQIFHGERLIGGYTELAALDRKDQLASLRA